MYELSIQTAFSAAHRLRQYQGDCEALHGHNWKVHITVRAHKLNDIGLAIDFKTLKQLAADVLTRMDHAYLNEIEPFQDMNPSSEHIAQTIYREMGALLVPYGVQIARVTVWESDNAWAAYYEG